MKFRLARLLVALALSAPAAAAAQPPAEEGLPEEREESDTDPAEALEPEMLKPPAVALPDRPLMVRVGGSLSYDSNLFRTPDASSERYATAYVGLSIDKAYAQQRFRLDVTETAYRYDNFSHLDFEALNYLGAWNWQLGPRIGGTLSATRAQSLVDYSEFRKPGELNMRTTENFAAGADAWLFGGWHLTGALSRVQQPLLGALPAGGQLPRERRRGRRELGRRSGNWLAFNLRELDGRIRRPPARPGGAPRRRLPAARDRGARRVALHRQVEPRGRAAWIDYRSDHFSERDFSGLAAQAEVFLAGRREARPDAGLAREVEPWTEARRATVWTQRVTLGADWQAAARTTLRLEARRGESDFRRPLPGFAGTLRHDREGERAARRGVARAAQPDAERRGAALPPVLERSRGELRRQPGHRRRVALFVLKPEFLTMHRIRALAPIQRTCRLALRLVPW